MNDYHLKLMKFKGEFVWHNHKDTDEAFIVLDVSSGTLFNNLIDRDVLAKKLEMCLAGVGFSVEKGESIANDGKYSLEG